MGCDSFNKCSENAKFQSSGGHHNIIINRSGLISNHRPHGLRLFACAGKRYLDPGLYK